MSTDVLIKPLNAVDVMPQWPSETRIARTANNQRKANHEPERLGQPLDRPRYRPHGRTRRAYWHGRYTHPRSSMEQIMKKRVVFALTTLAFPVKVEQLAYSVFVVTYGKQRTYCATYATACTELGQAILHALACDGKLAQKGDV